MKVKVSSVRSAYSWISALAVTALVVLFLLGVTSTVTVWGQNDAPCRVAGQPAIFCQDGPLPGFFECTALNFCRPNFTICTPINTVCSINGVAYTHSKTLRRWQVGTCVPIEHRTCVACGGNCAYICAIERLGSGTNQLNGDCLPPICEPHHQWAASGQCIR